MRVVKYFIYAFLILTVFLYVPVASAYSNFTPVIDTSKNIVSSNQTYNIYDQNFNPLPTYLFIGLLGIFFLTLSFLIDRNTEIFAALSILPLAYTAWGSLSIDVVTSFGMSALSDSGGAGNTWILMENHSIYPNIVLMIIFLILSVVAFMQFVHELMQGKTLEDVSEEPEQD
jgi:hypothetical protein